MWFSDVNNLNKDMTCVSWMNQWMLMWTLCMTREIASGVYLYKRYRSQAHDNHK